MSELPNNWTWSTVGAVTDYIQRGKSPKYAAASALPVINQKCIRWNELQLQHLKYIHPDQFSAWDEPRHIRPGDILWNSTGTGTVGRAYLVKEADCIPNKVVDSHVTIVRTVPGLEPRYLFNWIKSPAVQNKIEEMCDGTTNQIELSRTAIAETAIPVAPRKEQTRIADQLDTLLTRVKACNDHLEAIPSILKRYRRAVLNAAVRGKLIEDLFSGVNQKKSTLPISVLCLKQKHSFGIGPFGSDLKVADYRPCGVPLVFVRDIRSRNFGDIGTKFVSPEKAEQLAAHIVLPGDLLVTKMGEPPGDTAIYPDDRPPAVMTADVVRMRVDPEVVNARYLSYWFDSDDGREVVASITAGVAQRKISLERLRTISIELPDIKAQALIVRRVEALLGLSERIAARHTAMRAYAERLAPQVLTKAFRGELVEQDANDEPASVLLQRLSASQPIKAAGSRGRPRTQPQLHPGLKPTDWATLPGGEWAAPADPAGQSTTVCLTAVLRAWGQPMPERGARLAALLCQQPRLFSAVLPTAQARQWSRLVGDDAQPLPANVSRIQPATNSHWGQAIQRMRARGDLIEAGSGDVTWALGPGAVGIDTVGWPDGRASVIVAHLRAHGIESVLPSMNSVEQDFVNARAA